MLSLWLIAGLLSLALVAYWFGWFDRPMFRVAIAITAWLVIGGTAFAEETTVTANGPASATTTISLVPLYIQMVPYIAAGIGGLFLAVCSWAATKFLGIKLDQNDRSIIESAIQRAAGRVLAAQEGPIAGLKFDVHSQFVADEARKVGALVGGTLTKLGVTPDMVAAMIVGEIGKLQAVSPATVAVANVTAPAVVKS